MSPKRPVTRLRIRVLKYGLALRTGLLRVAHGSLRISASVLRHSSLNTASLIQCCSSGRSIPSAIRAQRSRSVDVAAYVAWFDYLTASGIIPGPQVHVLRELLAQRAEERDKMSDRAATVPSVRPLANQLARDCEVIAAAIEALGAPAREEDEEIPSSPPAGGDAVTLDTGDAFDVADAPKPRKGR